MNMQTGMYDTETCAFFDKVSNVGESPGPLLQIFRTCCMLHSSIDAFRVIVGKGCRSVIEYPVSPLLSVGPKLNDDHINSSHVLRVQAGDELKTCTLYVYERKVDCPHQEVDR